MWGQDELLTLPEAAELHWPAGPIGVKTLRTAVRDGKLPVADIAGKLFTCRRGISEMTRCASRTAAPARRPGPDRGTGMLSAAEARALLEEDDFIPPAPRMSRHR